MEWIAIVWAGFVATMLQLAFFGILSSLRVTQFSPTVQVGGIFLPNPRSPATDTIGYALLVSVGSTVVPLLYSFLLEPFGGPSWRSGVALGTIHGLLAAAALPLLGMISASIRAGAFPAPGPFGVRWGRFTPPAVVLGHTVYGGVAGAILAAF